MLSIIIFLYGVYDTITGPVSSEKRAETRIIPYFIGENNYGMIRGERTLEWALSTPPSYHHYDHIPGVNGLMEEKK